MIPEEEDKSLAKRYLEELDRLAWMRAREEQVD